jgi:CubicO group peptidase (beta-lactamase class C family)
MALRKIATFPGAGASIRRSLTHVGGRRCGLVHSVAGSGHGGVCLRSPLQELGDSSRQKVAQGGTAALAYFGTEPRKNNTDQWLLLFENFVIPTEIRSAVLQAQVRRRNSMVCLSVNRRQILGAIGGASASLLLPRITSAAASGNTERVAELLNAYVATKKVAGAVAVVGTRRGPHFVTAGHIAFAEGAVTAKPDSIWRIYSLTKLVTGAAAMLLIEDGKLAVDTPVADVFPTFKSPQVLVSPGASETRPARSAVTVRHLMTHTSGLVGSLVPEPPLSTFYVDRKLNVSRVSLEEDAKVKHQTSLLAFAAAAGTVPLAFDPGTQWSYGISSDVLGGVIEKVSGMPFEHFLESRLFHPLGMIDTSFTITGTKLSRFATLYQVSSKGLKPIDAPPHSIFAKPPPFPYPSSGLVSSARDFGRFTGMLLGEGALDGIRVLKTQTARLMMSNLLPDGVKAIGQGWGAGGLVLLATTTAATPFGVNRGTYGWEGAGGTVAWVDRTAGIYAVLMTQYTPSDAYSFHSDLTAAIFTDQLPPTRSAT